MMYSNLLQINFMMPKPLGTGGSMFSGCPSVRPSEAWNTLFQPVHGSVGPPDQAWPFCGMSVRLSVRPSGEVSGHLPENAWREWHGLKFHMLMYLDHLQNWLDYIHSLLIFLRLTPLWLSETGQIWGFQAFPWERIDGMACNFARWYILPTFKND